jgi:hypothetical protein
MGEQRGGIIRNDAIDFGRDHAIPIRGLIDRPGRHFDSGGVSGGYFFGRDEKELRSDDFGGGSLAGEFGKGAGVVFGKRAEADLRREGAHSRKHPEIERHHGYTAFERMGADFFQNAPREFVGRGTWRRARPGFDFDII